jgi:hypothetical protein
MIVFLAVITVGQGNFAPIPNSHQFFEGPVVAWAKESPKFAAVWPSELSPTSHNFVPNEVWIEQAAWLSSMLKPHWLPQDLRDRTLAFRNYNGFDILAVRYRTSASSLQILDTSGSVGLAVFEENGQTISLPAASESVQAFVKSVAVRYLNLTPSEVDDLDVTVAQSPAGGSARVSFGLSARSGYENDPKWWMIASGFTDGKAVYFTMPKALGGRQTSGAATSSAGDSRRRFLPG